jgi:hypothetical protein
LEKEKSGSILHNSRITPNGSETKYKSYSHTKVIFTELQKNIQVLQERKIFLRQNSSTLIQKVHIQKKKKRAEIF